MILLRLFFPALAVFCLLNSSPLQAEDTVTPFNPEAQFSSDIVTTSVKGQNFTSKLCYDKGKLRLETEMQGNRIIAILRPDLNKIYSVMVDQKMVLELPYDADTFKMILLGASGMHSKLEWVGPERVGDVACTKYEVRDTEKTVYFSCWFDAATKAPVKATATLDGDSFTLLSKNYRKGPQNAGLFEPPDGYKVMAAPKIPGL